MPMPSDNELLDADDAGGLRAVAALVVERLAQSGAVGVEALAEEIAEFLGVEDDRPIASKLREALAQQAAAFERVIQRALNELGVPGDGYPANIANAVEILRERAKEPKP